MDGINATEAMITEGYKDYGKGAVEFRAKTRRRLGSTAADKLAQVVECLNTLKFPKAALGFYRSYYDEPLWGRDRSSLRLLGQVDWPKLESLSITRYRPDDAHSMVYPWSWQLGIEDSDNHDSQELKFFAKRFVGVTDEEIVAVLKYLCRTFATELAPAAKITWFPRDYAGAYYDYNGVKVAKINLQAPNYSGISSPNPVK
jgi:hypothetical protein